MIAASIDCYTCRMNIRNHRLLEASQVVSDNCDARPADEVSLIVIHGISLPAGNYGGSEVIDLFCNQLDCSPEAFRDLEGLRVSSHLFIRRHGELIQFVPFDKRAWHAGESSHQGRAACNDFSVGIELEGTDHESYEPAQYDRLIDVCNALVEAYPIEALVGHADIAPGRKTDPGPAFNWQKLRSSVSI